MDTLVHPTISSPTYIRWLDSSHVGFGNISHCPHLFFVHPILNLYPYYDTLICVNFESSFLLWIRYCSILLFLPCLFAMCILAWLLVHRSLAATHTDTISCTMQCYVVTEQHAFLLHHTHKTPHLLFRASSVTAPHLLGPHCWSAGHFLGRCMLRAVQYTLHYIPATSPTYVWLILQLAKMM